MSRVTAIRGRRAEPLQVQLQWDGHTAAVIADGELDYATALTLTAHLTEALSRHPGRLILDLAGVTFIDCAGLSPIVRARNHLPPDVPLIVRAPSSAARRLFKMAHMEQVCQLET
ncbi:MAG: STAS domain-containing protein [Micromonosporaceae bacterium]